MTTETQTRNKAAERLYTKAQLDKYLAAERRATVERIRERFSLFGDSDSAKAMEQATTISLRDVRVILDEEAAR